MARAFGRGQAVVVVVVVVVVVSNTVIFEAAAAAAIACDDTQASSPVLLDGDAAHRVRGQHGVHCEQPLPHVLEGRVARPRGPVTRGRSGSALENESSNDKKRGGSSFGRGVV